MDEIDEIISEIVGNEQISPYDSFRYVQKCSRLLRNQTHSQKGRQIIINLLDNWHKLDAASQKPWIDLIESAGFYPYLEKEKERMQLQSAAGKLRKEFHSSDYLKGKYFHDEQKHINDILKSDKNLIVSAPTSFGKSILIEEIVASKKYRNIVIIQPTLALLDETRKKLKKYSDNFKIIIRTSQTPAVDKGNLFLLTAERVMEYTNFFNIDFFIIDEFYKLSAKRDDERCDTLNNAFNRLINKFKSKFYLLGPNIDGISAGFAEKYNAEFYKTDYSLVDIHSINVYQKHETEFSKSKNFKEFKETVLFDLLLELEEEQTIIYCSSPKRVREISYKFVKYLKDKGVPVKRRNLTIYEWILENVSRHWSFLDCLDYRIGIHDGALQKHITSSIISYFNRGDLKYLFCTSTIIEGVNTSAKNIVYFDSKKGFNEIDFFDYSNIKGRSGRLMIHYVGRIFNFNQPPERNDVIIDIPFFEQNPINDEVLIHLEEKDVRDKESTQYSELLQIPDEERAIIRENGLLVSGQRKTLEILKKDINTSYDLISWSGFPNYYQLTYVLTLAWENFLKRGETTRPMTLSKLIKVTFDYAMFQNISQLVENTYLYNLKLSKNSEKKPQEIYDEAVMDSFQILRHWFHYKVPKWLNVVHELQKYVCNKNGLNPGNYSYYASQLENDFVRQNLAILVEYGVPKSAIDKLSGYLSTEVREDDVISAIKKEKLAEKARLIPYEFERLQENL
ncbi:MAG: DEAD/DEAH box helicase [Candidatus Omnitrophota bacterium]